MNPTIQVTPSGDTGAIDVSGYKAPIPMAGALGGIVLGWSLSKKHKFIGAILGLGIGGYLGKAYVDSQAK
jgi:hypothetical protein